MAFAVQYIGCARLARRLASACPAGKAGARATLLARWRQARRAGLSARDNIRLPPTNRADEVRWAFMRWAHEHFGERDLPAVDGLLATVKSRFKCTN